MQQPLVAAPLKSDRVAVKATVAVQDTGSEGLATDAVRSLMWRSAGLFRTRESLSTAVDRLEGAYLAARSLAETAPDNLGARRRVNLCTVALLVARAALRREESRGGHFRADFPQRDDLHWRVHMVEQPA
jgi:L-aspartate oxidase